MTIKRMRLLSLLLGLLACQACSTVAWAEHPLNDSRRVANSASNIYWIDAHRVLFQGHYWNADGSLTGPDGQPNNSETLYEWDIAAGTLKEHGDIGGGLCYANGYVRYWRRINGESQGSEAEWLAGELGKQVNVGSQYVSVDRETCKPRNVEPLPDWTHGKAVLRLKPEHGFWVLGTEMVDRNNPVTYHPHGKPDGIVMPFRRREARLGSVKYVLFEDAYLIIGDYFVLDTRNPAGGYNKSPWPKGTPIPVWWLRPDGRVTETRLATDARFGVWIFAMRPGFFFISPGSSVDMDGLFFASETTVKRILKGVIDVYAVSPDGCKIAVNHKEKYGSQRQQGTLKVVSLCKTGT